MNRNRRGKTLLFFIIGIALILAAALAFLSRPPVLIVTDAAFADLYGTKRMLIRQLRASVLLQRLVLPVPLSETSDADMMVFAIEDAASRGIITKRPYCVLVPYSYADGVRRYREQFPGIPVVLMKGRLGPETGSFTSSGNPADTDPGGFFVFSTDQERDFYRAGFSAAILSRGKMGNIVVFQDNSVQKTNRDAFITGLREQGNETSPLFLYNLSQLSDSADISCVVLAGSGTEYFERNFNFPVILFSWLDPELSSRETVLIFDDSPWALTVPAVKLIAENRREERLQSDLLFFSAKIADKGISMQLKKALHDSR